MMLFPDTFRASSLKLLDEATDSPVVSSVNDAVPEIANGLAGPDLSTIGMVYVSCEQAERVRSRGTNMAWHRIRGFGAEFCSSTGWTVSKGECGKGQGT